MTGHFDFMIEKNFIKIACGGVVGCIPSGPIETCPSVPHVYTYIMLMGLIFMFALAPSH